jgi:CHASE2 domain-containing sensor protein
MGRKLLIESFFTTLFVGLVMYLLSFIPLNGDLVNPLSKTFADFELTDVVFSHMRENPTFDNNITMVNIGSLDREGVADLIEQINSHNPKVIGIDAFFRHAKEDTMIDFRLKKAFSKVKNLVLVSEMHENDSLLQIDSVSYSHNMFMQFAKPGFADMITEGRDFFKTSRDCNIFAQFQGQKIYSFPVVIAQIFDSVQTNKFLKRGNETEVINFQGNIDTRVEGVSANSKIIFRALDWEDVFEAKYVPEEAFTNKIVIMGYMGDYIGHQTWEDKFFTPLNTNYVGKANPDMYGVLVHANIVSMILRGKYINHMPEWLNYILTFIIVYLNIVLFSYIFLKLEIWYDGASFFLTLIEMAVIISIVLLIFEKYLYKIDISLATFALFLTGNMIEIYHGFVKKIYYVLKEKFVN